MRLGVSDGVGELLGVIERVSVLLGVRDGVCVPVGETEEENEELAVILGVGELVGDTLADKV